MKRLLPIAALCGLVLAACATGGPAAAPASASAPAPAAPAAASPAAPVSSLRDTQRLDREVGNAVIPYPFNTCAVIQKPFDREGPKHRRIYKGYEVLFCCTPCVKAFDANPEPYMPRIIAAAGGGTAAP